MLQIQVKVTGLTHKILAVCDGGAEVAIMSTRLYSQLQPQPELRPAEESVKGLYGAEHKPRGICTVEIEIPELSVIINYDVVIDDIEEDLLIDATMMQYAEMQLKYDTQELQRKGKVAKCIARLRKEKTKARRVMLQKDWVIQPMSRQLVAGKVVGLEGQEVKNWKVEPRSCW